MVQVSIAVFCQDGSKRVVLSENSTASSADILKGFQSKCPNVTLTLDREKADYFLEAMQGNRLDRSGQNRETKFTLFSKAGDAIYSTRTREISNAVKDVCNAINGVKKK